MSIPAASIQNVIVTIKGTLATGGSSVVPAENVFTYRRLTTVNPFTKNAVNTIFQANVLAPILLAANVRYTPGTVQVRILDDFNDAETVFTAAGVGAIVTDSYASNAAVYLLYRTALRGRSFRGSKHFAGLSEVDTTDDILTGAGLVRWQTVQAACLANLVDANGNTWTPTVLSRKLSQLNALPLATVVANDVTDVLLDLNVGTMRKRRSKTIR